DLEHVELPRSIGKAPHALSQNPVPRAAPEAGGLNLGRHVEAFARVVGARQRHLRGVTAEAVDFDEMLRPVRQSTLLQRLIAESWSNTNEAANTSDARCSSACLSLRHRCARHIRR